MTCPDGQVIRIQEGGPGALLREDEVALDLRSKLVLFGQKVRLTTSLPILSRKVGMPSSRPLRFSNPLHLINMTKRSSLLNARKNSAKPSAARDAAARRHVDLANREDCSAAIAEGIPLAALSAAAAALAPAPAPAPASVDPGAQLLAAIEGGILPAGGRDRARLPREDPGSAGASMDSPRIPAPTSCPPSRRSC